MNWNFPDGALFDIQLSWGRGLTGCRLVCADEETFTVDYDVQESLGRVTRLRGQYKTTDLINVTYRPVMVNAEISEEHGSRVGA